MTGCRVTDPEPFSKDGVARLRALQGRYTNWPIVYTLYNDAQMYVGETIHGAIRMDQHLKNEERGALDHMRFIIDEEFNKSAALDLERWLIGLFHADGQYRVLNKVNGISSSDYFDRDRYQKVFDQIFKELKEADLLTREVRDLVNSDFYKLSPFKSLNEFQELAVDEMTPRIISALDSGVDTEFVVQGGPGTGKTVVAIYMIKLLADIARSSPDDAIDENTRFSEHFTQQARETLGALKVAFVVPQQALRKTVERVFRRTPGMENVRVMDPFQVGDSDEDFDLVVVDEVHRLGLRANQVSGPQNKKFKEITQKLFGEDDVYKTQLDWVRAKSRTRILMIDVHQSVRPMDVSEETLRQTLEEAETTNSLFRLQSQMRLSAPDEYIEDIRTALRGGSPSGVDVGDYDLRLFDDLGKMVQEIRELEEDEGLARVVAGYAWEWVTKKKEFKHLYDIEEAGVRLRWNSQQVDWINSEKSKVEVGSIHTVQGYDLNYAGVIIGRDLRLDPVTGKVWFDPSNYYDKKGKEKNNKQLGRKLSDEDILEYVINIYSVLMSRGIKGTYLYVCDEPLREHFRSVLSTWTGNKLNIHPDLAYSPVEVRTELE